MTRPDQSQTPAAWWQRGVVYQVYPRSFQDSNGDGEGDLAGITRRLDYLQELGIDAIWLSPFYPSPMVDSGYDISDHCDVDPRFGALADFDALLAAAHQRGIRVIVDLVPCHTSDQHPWFLEARSARDSRYRDYFLWRDPAPDGGPPNNWLSNFGGPAWTLDPRTGQYYLHSFAREQPDLNLRNPAVEAELHAILRFWLDRGVEGFRVDVINGLLKDPQWRDNPPNPAYKEGMNPFRSQIPIYSRNQKDAHLVIARLRQVIDSYPGDHVMIGEAYLTPESLVAYYGPHLNEAHLPFNFQLIALPWCARTLRDAVANYEAALPQGAWPTWVMGNHDRHRVATRVGPAQARIAAMLLLTLRGAPTWYYGDELGMQDVPIPPDRVQDPWERNVPGLGLGRDPERTPMQWDEGPGAGFTTGDPWLPLAADCQQVNVAAQSRDPRSMLTLVRALLRVRKAEAALSLGAYAPLTCGASADEQVLAFLRICEGSPRYAVVLNLRSEPCTVRLMEGEVPLPGPVQVVLSTHLDGDTGRAAVVDPEALTLRGDEGLLLRLP